MKQSNILVAGNGGREHAMIWKLKQSSHTGEIFCTMGNAGINRIAKPVNIKPDAVNDLAEFARNNNIELTVVGPEIPLSKGIVNEFVKRGLKVFGPSREAARLETSKIFAKEFMKHYGIPTASFEKFHVSKKDDALSYLNEVNYPVVLKADGLAAGKGVIICANIEEALKAVNDIFVSKIFGTSGDDIVIEEFLTGDEASVFAVTDGEDYVVLPPAQDHKKIFDGEKGKNTGGMGSFAPAYKIVTPDVLNKVKSRIIEPVLKYMKDEGNEFKGCLYCGLMINKNGDPYVVEFNVRFGDPETQAVLPLIESDFFELLLASAEGRIKDYSLRTNNEHCCSVVLASKGYPDEYETGKIISGLEKAGDDCIIFHAGTKGDSNGNAITSGGRVLNVVGRSDSSLKSAIESAYRNAEVINFENKYYRKDIGIKGL